MNNYHIYEEIGRGKYSVVYKGRRKKTIQYVAVKSVERTRKKKLMNEVSVFHNLDHKNVLKFDAWYETRNHLWIIFEFCPGGDLYRLLDEDKHLPEQTIKKFSYDILEGLSYLHEKGIILADLKPSNILFNEFSQLKLADFGLSRKIVDLVREQKEGGEKKRDNAGSVYYMAPELFQDNGVLSYFSDFWSLGVVMYELATGRLPFAQSSLQKLLKAIMDDSVKEVSNFSDDFNDLLKRLLQKDPVQRITWHEIKAHPFWYSSKPVYQFNSKVFYPDQPQFEKYLHSRGIDPAVFKATRETPIAEKFLKSASLSAGSCLTAGPSTNVDIMRLSMNVKRNLLRDAEENDADGENNYHQAAKKAVGSERQYQQRSNNQNRGDPTTITSKPRDEESQRESEVDIAAGLGDNGSSTTKGGSSSSLKEKAQPPASDVNLANKNVVLDFGEEQADKGTVASFQPSITTNRQDEETGSMTTEGAQQTAGLVQDLVATPSGGASNSLFSNQNTTTQTTPSEKSNAKQDKIQNAPQPQRNNDNKITAGKTANQAAKAVNYLEERKSSQKQLSNMFYPQSSSTTTQGQAFTNTLSSPSTHAQQVQPPAISKSNSNTQNSSIFPENKQKADEQANQVTSNSSAQSKGAGQQSTTAISHQQQAGRQHSANRQRLSPIHAQKTTTPPTLTNNFLSSAGNSATATDQENSKEKSSTSKPQKQGVQSSSQTRGGGPGNDPTAETEQPQKTQQQQVVQQYNQNQFKTTTISSSSSSKEQQQVVLQQQAATAFRERPQTGKITSNQQSSASNSSNSAANFNNQPQRHQLSSGRLEQNSSTLLQQQTQTGGGGASQASGSGSGKGSKPQTARVIQTEHKDQQQYTTISGKSAQITPSRHDHNHNHDHLNQQSTPSQQNAQISSRQNALNNNFGANLPKRASTARHRKPVRAAALGSSPQDLQLLADNKLFSGYQLSHTSTNSSTGASNQSSSIGGSSDVIQKGGKAVAIVQGQKTSKVPHKPIEQLIIHNSDNQVKPIIGNKDIERVAEVRTNTENLPFRAFEPQFVAENVDSNEIEYHLNEVYEALYGQNTVNEKLNTLNYFESIINNSNVSNRLINSAFVKLLVQMLRSIKQPSIKIRLCSVLGLLIRHSTVIDNELAETGICACLVETLREQRLEKVRRKAIAALGEYMFYAATQMDDDTVDPIWELTPESITIIQQCISGKQIMGTTNTQKNDHQQQSSLTDQQGGQVLEDDIVRFYACKSLENICAQSNSAGHKFATSETISHLLNIFLNPNQLSTNTSQQPQQQQPQSPQFYEALKTSAAVALSHICGLNHVVFGEIFEKISAPVFCHTLTEGIPRVQQAFITMLNLALRANSYPRISEVLLKDQSFLPALISLHEHNSIVIRGKCLLTFLLLFKLDFRWISVVQNKVKFFNMLDRVHKDNYKYVQCCLLCLIDGILEIVPTIFQTVASELSALIAGGGQVMPGLHESPFDQAISVEQANQLQRGGNLFFISVLLDLQTNQIIRTRMINYPFIRSLAALLDSTNTLVSASVLDQQSSNETQVADVTSGSAKSNSTGTPLTEIAYEFQYTLLLVGESISTNLKVIVQMHDAIISYLLPVMHARIIQTPIGFAAGSQHESQEQQGRFLSLKIITDTLALLLSEEHIYLPHQSQENLTKRGALTQSGLLAEPGVDRLQNQILSTYKINSFLADRMLNLVAQLLERSEPEPFYGQRLLSSILDKNINFVNQLRQIKVAKRQTSTTVSTSGASSNHNNLETKKQLWTPLQFVAHFFQVGSKNLNKHTIIIMKSLVESKDLSFDEMAEFKIIDKTYQLISTMVGSKQDWCIEMLLEINHHILTRFNLLIRSERQREQEISWLIDDIFSNFNVCVQLLNPNQFEVPIMDKASHCLIQMLQLYALRKEKKREIYFIESHMGILVQALDCERRTIQKRLLKCIYWALVQGEYQIEFEETTLRILTQKVEALQSSSEKSLAQTSQQISDYLRKEMPLRQANFKQMKGIQQQALANNRGVGGGVGVTSGTGSGSQQRMVTGGGQAAGAQGFSSGAGQQQPPPTHLHYMN